MTAAEDQVVTQVANYGLLKNLVSDHFAPVELSSEKRLDDPALELGTTPEVALAGVAAVDSHVLHTTPSESWLDRRCLTPNGVEMQAELGALGYEALPLTLWTREQLQEQLKLLTHQDVGVPPLTEHWNAKRSLTEFAVTDAVAKHQHATLAPAPLEDCLTTLKRRAIAEMEMQQGQSHYPNIDATQQKIIQQTFMAAAAAANGVSGLKDAVLVNSAFATKAAGDTGSFAERLLSNPHANHPLCRTETKLISTDEGSQVSTTTSDIDSEFDFTAEARPAEKKRLVRRAVADLPRCDTTIVPTSTDEGAYINWNDLKLSVRESYEEDKNTFAQSLPESLRQDYINFTKNGVLTNDLRQEYIRRSKLYPKVRGVWFNSTVRRMGWVGQAYKKCKRIEKIFSISRHGFDGARELAIAFRNSQKPTGSSIGHDDAMTVLDTSYSVMTNDDFTALDTTDRLRTEDSADLLTTDHFSDLHGPLVHHDSFEHSFANHDVAEKQLLACGVIDEHSPLAETPESAVSHELTAEDVDQEFINQYKSEHTPDQKLHRDALCKDSLRFMLYELAVLMELDVVVPGLSKMECQRGVQYHIDALEACVTIADMLPYIAIFGTYICKGLTPVDMPYNEVFTVLRAFAHCRPLDQEFKSEMVTPFVRDAVELNLVDLIVT